MKTLNLYVAKSFLSTGSMGIIILTFGLMGVNLIRIIEFLSRGIPPSAAFAFILYLLPSSLSLSIPVSVLVSVMLVFGRMSADNEITAMRACGISIFQITAPIIVIVFILTTVCLYLQLDLGPMFSAKSKQLIKAVGVKYPLAIIEPGRTIKYENLQIYVDDLEDKILKNIQIFILSKDEERIQQDITAARGRIEVDDVDETMSIILENATIIVNEAGDEPKRRSFSDELAFEIDYGKKFNDLKIQEVPRLLTLKELFGMTRFFRKNDRDTTALEVELNKRIALGLSPLAFLLLGLPLAIRTSRRETSINLFVSVMLAAIYFITILIFQAIDSKPQLHPELLLWIPNLVYQGLGLFFLFKLARA